MNNKKSKLFICILLFLIGFLISVYYYNLNPWPQGEQGWTTEDFLNSGIYKDYIKERTINDLFMFSSLAGFVIVYFMFLLEVVNVDFSKIKKPVFVLTIILILISITPILQLLTVEIYDFFFFLDFTSNAGETLGRFYTHGDFSRGLRIGGWILIILLSFFFASSLVFFKEWIFGKKIGSSQK